MEGSNCELHNITVEKQQAETTHLLLVTVFTAMLLPPILIGNILILLAVRKVKNLRNITLFYIGQLAISDIAFGVATVLRIALAFSYQVNLSKVVCQIALCTLFVSGGSALSSILLLSMEGFLSVRFFIFFKSRFTLRVAQVSSVFTVSMWIILMAAGLGASPSEPDSILVRSCDCHLGHSKVFHRSILKVIVMMLWVHVLFIFIFLVDTFRIAKQKYTELHTNQRFQLKNEGSRQDALHPSSSVETCNSGLSKAGKVMFQNIDIGNAASHKLCSCPGLSLSESGKIQTQKLDGDCRQVVQSNDDREDALDSSSHRQDRLVSQSLVQMKWIEKINNLTKLC